MASTVITFDGVDISALTGVNLHNHEFNDMPNRDIKSNKLARSNMSAVATAEYVNKEVRVSMQLMDCNRDDTELVLSTLKSNLQGVNKDLIVSQFGSSITYQDSTLNELDYHWLSNKLVVNLTFYVADPIGFVDSASAFITTVSGNTASTVSATSTNAGSFSAEPVFTVTVNSGTGLTDQSVTIENGATGQGIQVTRTWIAGDVLEIDCREKTVDVNGVITDFVGQFPSFNSGTGSVTYVDTFTTRNVDIAADYFKRYA